MSLVISTLLNANLRRTPHRSVDRLVSRTGSRPTPVTTISVPSNLLTRANTAPNTIVGTSRAVAFVTLGPNLLAKGTQSIAKRLRFSSLKLSD